MQNSSESPSSVHRLDYYTPAVIAPGCPQPMLAYFISTSLGAALAVAIGTVADVVLERISPRPPGPTDELGIGVCGVLIFVAVFIAIGSLIASGVFRACCGRIIWRTRRFVATLGAINGLIGMGAFGICGALREHKLIDDYRTAWNAVIGVNVALPIIMGIISRTIIGGNKNHGEGTGPMRS